MSNFLRYALRETVSNLWRNRLMTMAAILTVTVSLGLVGSALYIKQGASQASAAWERETEVLVFMNSKATTEQMTTIKQEFYTSPYVIRSTCQFWSKRKDFNEAHRIDASSIYSHLTLATTPSSYRCTPAQPGQAQYLVAQFNHMAGVYQVVAPLSQIHAVETTVNWLQLILFLIAVVLMISAGVLILNTIRMAIFARRREISVMKLVGATNWFIRLPFIAEGLIQGLVGALLASALVYGIHVTVDSLSPGADPTSLLAEMRLSAWHVFGTDLVVVIVGGAIGALGSAFAVRRFLDV